MGPFGCVDFHMVPPTILAIWGKMGPDATTGGTAKPGHIVKHAKSMAPRQAASSSRIVAMTDIPTIVDVDVDSSINTIPSSPSKPLHPPLQFNLRELLELEACGERVMWPQGFDAVVAATYIADYELAIHTGYYILEQ